MAVPAVPAAEALISLSVELVYLSFPFSSPRGLNMIQNYLEEVTDKFLCTLDCVEHVHASCTAVYCVCVRRHNKAVSVDMWCLHIHFVFPPANCGGITQITKLADKVPEQPGCHSAEGKLEVLG